MSEYRKPISTYSYSFGDGYFYNYTEVGNAQYSWYWMRGGEWIVRGHGVEHPEPDQGLGSYTRFKESFPWKAAFKK